MSDMTDISPHLLADAEALSNRLPHLIIQAQKIANNITLGFHGRKKPGIGTSFWQFRDLRQGENIQRVDWRRSAKSQNLYVKDTEYEAAQRIYLWLETYPGMAYHSTKAMPIKFDHASLLLLCLANLAANQNEHLRLLGQTKQLSNKMILSSLCHAMRTHHAQLAHAFEKPLIKNADVVIVSDFLTDMSIWRKRLSAIAQQGARLILIQVLDKAESDFPFAGRVEFKDTETSEKIDFGRTQDYRVPYIKKLAKWSDELRSYADKSKGFYTLHTTDQALTKTLIRCLYFWMSSSSHSQFSHVNSRLSTIGRGEHI